MVMDYRYKFNNVLSIINTDISAVRKELLEIKVKFQKKESGFAISKDINNKVIYQMKLARKNLGWMNRTLVKNVWNFSGFLK